MGTQVGDGIRSRWLALATAALLALSAAPAAAYDVDPAWIATDYATGFPAPADGGAGPIGMAFDGSGTLLVTDLANGAYYRIPPGGGRAPANVAATGLGRPAGLAFGLDGNLYMARADSGRVDQVDARTGAVVRTLASGLPCPTALATDPLSGDIFASNKCAGASIQRISMARGSASNYTAGRADGLMFAPDGALFAALDDSRIDRIAGTNAAAPGSATHVADVHEIDGLAYVPARAGEAAYLVANSNDGQLIRVELDGRTAPVLSGASRGDLVTVGPDRCIYAAYTDRIVKVAPAQGTCSAAPPAGQFVLGAREEGGSAPGGGGAAAARVLDLRLKVRGPKRARSGKRFAYVLRVSNRGPSAAHGVVVRAGLPKGLRFVKVVKSKKSRAKCARKGRLVGCFRKSLAKRASFRVRVLVKARRAKRYVTRFDVMSSDLDNAPANNRAKLATKVKRRASR
jgi:uncharacterized repeat protein (TIGR01451 family)